MAQRKLLKTLIQDIDWVRQHPGFALLVRIGRQVIVLGIPELAVIARPDEKVCYSLNTALPVQQLRQTAEGRDPGQLRRMV